MRGDARHDDYGPRAYASIPERITWTKGFTAHVDKHVLGSLATFANFKTGIRANMRLELLSERSGVSRRTLLRSLKRLEAEGWVSAQHRHRHPTTYDINVERLATTWLTTRTAEIDEAAETAEVEETDLSATRDTQPEDFHTSLSATNGTQIGGLSAIIDTVAVKNGTQISYKEALNHRQLQALAARSDTRSPSIDPQYKTDPQVIRATRGDLSPPSAAPPPNALTPDPNWPQRFATTLRQGLNPHRTRVPRHV